MTEIDKKTLKALAFAALTALMAGFTNGFLGAGGGIILLFALGRLNPRRDESALRDNFACVVAVVLLLSTVSAVTYSKKESLDTSSLFLLALPGMAGGVLGAHLTDRLRSTVLRTVFSVIIIIAGINMLK